MVDEGTDVQIQRLILIMIYVYSLFDQIDDWVDSSCSPNSFASKVS